MKDREFKKYSLLNDNYTKTRKDWHFALVSEGMPIAHAVIKNGKGGIGQIMYLPQRNERKLWAMSTDNSTVYSSENMLENDELFDYEHRYYTVKDRLLEFLHYWCENEGGLVRTFGLSGPGEDNDRAQLFIFEIIAKTKQWEDEYGHRGGNGRSNRPYRY